MSSRTIRIGGYGPRESAHGTGLSTFRHVVQEQTGGEVTVDITWNIMDQGRPNTDLLDLVETGEMFMCYFSTSYLGRRVPELNVLETPYLFEDLDAAHGALDGELGRALSDAVRSQTGFQVLGFWDNGFRHLTNRLRPVHRVEDCRDMTVRLQPNAVHEELIRSWGAVPVAVELSRGIDLIVGLEVDAQENPLANTVAYGVDRLHPHVTMTGHLYGARGLFAQAGAVSALEAGLREVVSRAATEAVRAQRAAAAGLELRLRDRMTRSGTRFVDLAAPEMRGFVEASAAAIAMAHDTVDHRLFGMLPR